MCAMWNTPRNAPAANTGEIARRCNRVAVRHRRHIDQNNPSHSTSTAHSRTRISLGSHAGWWSSTKSALAGQSSCRWPTVSSAGTPRPGVRCRGTGPPEPTIPTNTTRSRPGAIRPSTRAAGTRHTGRHTTWPVGGWCTDVAEVWPNAVNDQKNLIANSAIPNRALPGARKA